MNLLKSKKGAVAGMLTGEVKAWAQLGIIIVVVSIILVKFKSISGATSETNDTVDSIVTGLQEPANWLTIVITAVIGFALFRYFSKKQ